MGRLIKMDGGQLVTFNPEATRWLGVWLDSGLNLKAHYQTCMRKARAAEARVLRLCQGHGLAPGLARQVQVAAVQSIALYGAELWWQGQRDRQEGIQLMINRQARAITGMLKTTPVGPLVREAGLIPAEVLLEARQLEYTNRLLGLPEDHPAKKILPGYEVFDAELLGVVRALQMAKKVGNQGPVTVLLDFQAAIARLQHTQTGPGQALAVQEHMAAQELQDQGREPTIQWVPGHAGVEGNERADQAAKLAASRPPGAGPREISLAFGLCPQSPDRGYSGTKTRMAHQGAQPLTPTGPTVLQAT
ncbi:ribonuclease H family protein [Aspergillus affinis]|uniref:ribonuclease H family protein n=1 Tax=Aspergillus affinis TaxID=1070780 RepID=UPI0022FE5BE9|nr:uncharacterized protein KD926_002853 [Aspergillus affinis]KAI9035824.1 hypothetical protein KD926_002853 [Aspergillus affinis]